MEHAIEAKYVTVGYMVYISFISGQLNIRLFTTNRIYELKLNIIVHNVFTIAIYRMTNDELQLS